MFLICTLALDLAYLWGQRQDPPCHRRARVKALEWIREEWKNVRQGILSFFCDFCLSLRVACTHAHTAWAAAGLSLRGGTCIRLLSAGLSLHSQRCDAHRLVERGGFFSPFFFLFIIFLMLYPYRPRKREDWEGSRRFLRELVFRLQPFKQTQMLDSSSTCDLWHHGIKRDVVKENKGKGR